MSNRAWMPLHITDYLADTGHLSAAEHGAYMLLIMHYWQNGSLPENERLIARIARMDAQQWEESRDIIAMLFGPNWTHKRIDGELAKADEIIEKRRNAALGRHSKNKRDASAEQVHSKCSDTGALPRTNNQSSSLRSDDKRTPRVELEVVLDAEHADAVLDHRKRIRKPLTQRAAKLLAAKFSKCSDPNAAADAMIANGWQGFEPDWLDRPIARGSPARARPMTAAELNRQRSMQGHYEHDDAGQERPDRLALGHLSQLPVR